MTVKEMYLATARMVDEDINLDGNIDSDTQSIIKKFLDSFNYSYRKVAKDKLLFLAKEEIELEDKTFNTDYLANTHCLILSVKDKNGNTLHFEDDGDGDIVVDTSEDSVIVHYYYLPRKLEALDDSTKFPSDVDERILCYYASYEYLNMEGGSEERNKAQDNLLAYNDALDSIKKRKGPKKYVRKVDDIE